MPLNNETSRASGYEGVRRRAPVPATRTPWTLAIALLLADAGAAHAAPPQSPLRFTNEYFRDADGKPLDVSRFAHGNPVVPGNYPVELYINDIWTARLDVDVGVNADGAARVCLPMQMLVQAGLDINAVPDAARAMTALADGPCIDPLALVPGARVAFDSGELRLDVELPQAYLLRRPRGYVDPALWDQGVTGAILGYDANVFRNWSSGVVSTQGYVGLDGGFNFRGWQLRHQGTFTASETNREPPRHRYTALSTYLRHDVTALHARFIGGQFFTPGDMFDSFAFTGVQISSDDRMLPETMRSYAPVVRGVASSNARVTVRQGTNIVYETSVPPGPFVIDDLYDTGYAGDLTVTVTEADGSSHSFPLPYASIPQLLRPGTHRFSATAGTLRDDTVSTNRTFFQGTYRRGLTNGLTLYGGVTAAQQYQTVLGGMALSTPLGAIAADMTQSWAQGLPDTPVSAAVRSTAQGQTYRLTYNKRVDVTDTNIMLGAYRYSSSGYMSLLDAERSRGGAFQASWRIRHRFQLVVSQPLAGDLGTLYVNGYTANFWQRQGSDVTFSAGYTRTFRFGTLNLNVQRSRSQMGNLDTQIMATVSIPLGSLPHTPALQLRTNYTSGREIATQASVTGTANDARTLTYNAYGEYRNPCCGNGAGLPATGSGGVSASYLTSIGTIGAAASGGSGYSQVSASLSGGLVAHAGGLTLSQRIGEAVAVIEAPGAEGASVLNAMGVHVGTSGFAVHPMLSPYQMNEVGLDSSGTRDDVDVLGSSTSVAPRTGAVVMVRFRTEQGLPLMFRVVRANGMPVPPGAEVVLADGKPVATAGQGGLVFLRGKVGDQAYSVRWGANADQQCTFRYTVDVPRAGEEIATMVPAVRVACKQEEAS